MKWNSGRDLIVFSSLAQLSRNRLTSPRFDPITLEFVKGPAPLVSSLQHIREAFKNVLAEFVS